MIDHAFFKKYQWLILWFANTKLGKLYLCSGWNRSKKRIDWNWIKTEKFDVIFPSGYTVDVEKGRHISKFYTDNHFAKKLALFLFWLPYWQGFFNENGELFFRPQYMFPVIALIVGLPVLAGTISTFNPAVGANSPVDGNTNYVDPSDTWATVRAATATSATPLSTIDNAARFRCSTTTNQYDRMIRGHFLFATGDTISTGSTINATADTKLTLIGSSLTDALSQSVSLVSTSPASNNNLVVGDHLNLGTTIFGTDIALSSWSATAANVWTLNADGRAAITLGAGGITKLGTRMSGDRTNTEPTWSSLAAPTAGCVQADNGTNKPALSVDWVTGSIAPTNNLLLMGV